MVLATVALPSGELSAFQDDAPIILAANRLRSPTSAIWSSGSGVVGDTDRTIGNSPTSNAHDGFGVFGTQGSDGGGSTTWHYVAELAAESTADAALVVFTGNPPGNLNNITVQVDDNGSFTTAQNVFVAAGLPYLASTSSVRVFGKHAMNYYTGITHIRVTFTFAASQTLSPSVGEIYIGRSRQFSRQWNYGQDDEPIGATIDRFEGRARGIVHYQRAYGFRDFTFEFTPSGLDHFDLDDVATARGVYTDSSGGNREVVWVQHPWSTTSISAGTRVGSYAHLGVLSPGLRLPKLGPFERSGRLEFFEQPPFQLVET